MLQTMVIHELDRQLAEARAITMATMRGFRYAKVLERERISGAWRFVVDPASHGAATLGPILRAEGQQ